MKVFCPRNGRGNNANICEFEGGSNQVVEDVDIYTEEGFRDLYIDTSLIVVCTPIHIICIQ